MQVLESQPQFLEPAQPREVTILCGLCGTSFPPTSTGTNVCLKCISTHSDVSSGITKQAILNYCRTCKRWLRPPWTHAELESKELLALCLRRVRGLNKVKLVDASFIWTEPHSRRIKVKLTIQKETMNNVNVQQTFPIEFVVYYQQCEDCKKEYTPHTWGAMVQVRQKAEHKKTLFFLEQLILKYNAHDKVLRIKEMHEGIDFYYKEKTHAARLVDFLQGMFATRIKHSKQLISQDFSSNTCNYKYVYSVDLPKVSKDDLVVLKPKHVAALGGCSSLLICTKVAMNIQLVDPINMKVIDMNSVQYFNFEDEMTFIPSKGNLSEFLVFNHEPCEAPNNGQMRTNKLKIARLQVGRVKDWENFEVKTYLGDILKEGSYAMGYDLSSLCFSGLVDDSNILKSLPDVIMIKKAFPEAKNLKKRIWRLKQLEKEAADTKAMNKGNDKQAKDYEEFLNDLETDPELRGQINLYRNEKAIKDRENGNAMDDENATEDTSGKKSKKQHKKKLKVKKGKKKAQGTAAAAGAAGEEAKEPEENKNEIQDEDEEDGKGDKDRDEDDQMVKVEELLADMNLEDQGEVEDNGDEIDDFIRRLEKVKIEGKE